VPPMFGLAAGIDSPPSEKHYTIKDSFVLPVDVEAHGVRGHAHYLAHEMKMTATLPDGSTKGLLWISDWDFGWQDSYFFKTPFTLPKGSRVDAEIVYANSDLNMRTTNSPPKRMNWGYENFQDIRWSSLVMSTDSRHH